MNAAEQKRAERKARNIAQNPFAPTFNAAQIAACQRVRQSLLDFERVFASAMQPFMQQFGQQCKALHRLLKDAYQEAGQPYGDTEAGFLQWIQEQGEAEWLQQSRERKSLPSKYKGVNSPL